MLPRPHGILALLALLPLLPLLPACGSQRVAGYVEELEHCSMSSSDTGTTKGSSSGDDTTTSESSGGEKTETTGTSAGTDSTADPFEGTETTETSTGDPTAECGNGIIEMFGPDPEECDDNNLDPNDGCSETCALDRRAFVTSELYNGAAVGSLKSADARCANLADDQGWPDGLKYRAWLSDSTTDARDRFTRGRGRLVLANGLILAQSWTALLAGQLDNPLDVTEASKTYQGGVWTGTRPDGAAVPDSEHCDDWSTSSITKTAYYGYSDRTTAEWTMAIGFDQPSDCASPYALYCFQSL